MALGGSGPLGSHDLRLLFIPFAAYDEAEGLKLLEAVSVDNVKAVEMILQQPRDPNFCDLGEDA